MAIEEHPFYPRFPGSIVPESGFTPRWVGTDRSSTLGADARIQRASRPYFSGDCSGCKCNEKQKDTLFAILWRSCGTIPVLVRVPPFCEIGVIIGRDRDSDNPIVEPAFLGVGTGGDDTFQIRKEILVPGYDDPSYYDVTKPYIDYPPEYAIGSTAAGPIKYEPMAELTVYRGALRVEVNRAYWDVDKDTGEITTHGQTGNLYCSGGFYIPMLLPPQGFPMSPDGGNWIIKNGVTLEEPPGSR